MEYHFEDLDRFAHIFKSVKPGSDAVAEMTRYIEGSSPGFRAFAKAYSTTPETLAKAVTRRPKHYASMGSLKRKIKEMEPSITEAISKLSVLAGGKKPVPVYFLVADMKAGGTPKEVELPDGTKSIAVLVALEILSITPESDMSEFPNYNGVPVAFSNLPQVVIHEMVHVFQASIQGLDNYRSIFDPKVGTNLSIAIREGAAEYLTYLVSGCRLGDRHLYGAKHEAELWKSFLDAKDKPAHSVPGWFDGGIKERPELPSQIGYWVGMQICREYHESAVDKDSAIGDLFSAYTAEHFNKIVEPYARKFRN